MNSNELLTEAMKASANAMFDNLDRQVRDVKREVEYDGNTLVVNVWNAALDEAANLSLDQATKERIRSIKKKPLE